MSLFAAYSEDKTIKKTSETPEESQYNWLSLKSYDNQKIQDFQQQINEEIDAKCLQTVPTIPQIKTNKDNNSDVLRSKEPKKRSVSESVNKELINKTFIEETGLSPQNAFRIDKRSDKNNLAFNSLYYKYVANYDKKRCINTTKKRSKDNICEKNKKKQKLRYFSRENQVLMKTEDIIDLSKPDSKPIKSSLNYIPLKQAFNELPIQSNSNSNPLGVYDLKTSLWSEGKGKLDEIPLPQSSIQFTSMKTNSDTNAMIGPIRCPTREQYVYEKTQEFNSYLRDNENDIQKWLQFIAFQDKIVDKESDKIDGKSTEIAVSEKKLSVCEKALKSNPKSIELLLKRIEILSNVWEFDKLYNEWKQLTFLYPNSMDLWRKYLRFSQNNITNFSANKTIKIYQKCVSILSKMLEKTFQSHSPPEDLENEMISIVSSYCYFMESIGHTERAVSTFQALIEFNLFTPNLLSLEMPVQDWITFFEPFWDCGSARFGEDGALGWDQVMLTKNMENKSKDSEINSYIDEEENRIIAEKLDKNLIWLKFELLRESYYWLPSRSDAEEVDDPERLVVSDDVIKMLFRLRTIDAKYLLVKHFLHFLGIKSVCDLKLDESFGKTIDIKNFSIELPLLPNYCDQQMFVNNIFQSSIKLFSAKNKLDFILIWINYEKHKTKNPMNVKNMRKFIKGFLRDEEFRNCLDIWSAFAGFEYTIDGNVVEGRKVFQTAISLMINNKNDLELYKFVRNYVELELGITSLSEMSVDFHQRIQCDLNRDQLSLNALLSVISGQLVSKSTPTLILKAINSAKQAINPTNDQLFCYVFIHYLTQGISSTVQLIEEQLSRTKTSIEEQRTFIIYLQLLLLHTHRSPGISLKQLRSVLNRALYLYSTNEQFLSLFVNLELNSNIFSQMRRFFTKTINSFTINSFDDNWNLIIYAIHSELKRLKASDELFTGFDTNSGVINRVRVLFENSLSTPQLSQCVTLWRLYCKFEMDCNNKSRAKSVFYRALQHCSYSKILFLDGIQYFGSQLQELLDIMTEKELRVRTPIEEIDLLINNFE